MARFADLEHGAPDLPALTDPGAAHVHAAEGQILTEEPGAELPLPPPHVLARVGVDGFVRAPVDALVGLEVALQAEPPDDHRTLDRPLIQPGRSLAPPPDQRTRLSDVHGDHLAHGFHITLPGWPPTGSR